MYQCGLAGIPGVVHRKKVWYLKQINEVSEILKQSQKVAEECNKCSMSVTYDLATAKLAMPILAEEKPTYITMSSSILDCFTSHVHSFLCLESTWQNQVDHIF